MKEQTPCYSSEFFRGESVLPTTSPLFFKKNKSLTQKISAIVFMWKRTLGLGASVR